MGADGADGLRYLASGDHQRMKTERSGRLEVRMTGGVLVGKVAYNVRSLDRAEMFDVGAFTTRDAPLELRLQHDRGRRPVATTEDGTLIVTDTDRAFRLEARLRKGSAERSLAERGSLTGLSVEFHARREDRQDGVRIIRDAHLAGIGLVDRASYPSSVEMRARFGGSWFRASIPMGKPMQCRCQGPDCDSVVFDEGAFDGLGADGDVLAVGGGGFSNVLGSLRRESLVLEAGKKNFRIGLTNADTVTARRIVEEARSPIFSPVRSWTLTYPNTLTRTGFRRSARRTLAPC